MYLAMRHLYSIFSFALQPIPMQRGREAPKTLEVFELCFHTLLVSPT